MDRSKEKSVLHLLARLGMTSVSYGYITEAKNIVDVLDCYNEYDEMKCCITALCFMYQKNFEEALLYMEPKADKYQSLICYIILSANSLNLASKVDHWLKKAESSDYSYVKSFGEAFKEHA